MDTTWARRTAALNAAVRRAAVRAVRAPSVHNTQPWRFVLRPGALEVTADWSRQLPVLDPTGRQLLLSCGCAVFNARVALAAAGRPVVVERFPDPAESNLIARLTVDPLGSTPPPVETYLAALDAVIGSRQSNRRQFDTTSVPAEVVEALVDAARQEGAQLVQIRRPEDRAAVARLSQLADHLQNQEPEYRAELRRWTTDSPGRMDGVPASAVPHVDGIASEDDIPIRDFDTRGTGSLPTRTRSSSQQCLLLLGTNADNPAAWARAGEALQRIWLELAMRGYTASLFSQPIEVPMTRERLRAELRLGMRPHMLLRVGRAAPTPLTRRRRLIDVLVEPPVTAVTGPEAISHPQ